MNVIPKNLPSLNNVILYPLLKIIFTMLITGFISATAVRIIFFWVPRAIKNYLTQIGAGMGVIAGLYIAFVIFKF